MSSVDWSKRITSAKGKYSTVFFLLFVGMNLLVDLTYKWSGRISFSYLVVSLPFEGFFGDLTGYTGIGVLVFAVSTFILIWGVISLIGTRLRIIGWLLLLMIFASALPIIDYRKIFI